MHVSDASCIVRKLFGGLLGDVSTRTYYVNTLVVHCNWEEFYANRIFTFWKFVHVEPQSSGIDVVGVFVDF